MQPKLKKEENDIKDVELIDSDDFKRNKEFSNFIDSYNKTLTLFYKTERKTHSSRSVGGM